ncbi:PFL_4703 family integrating conjugative element protein [Methylotuvimicrobium sp. KM1]|uniref:PFL_4703 family integrating conjugative element protein n=1 Tax=Methylotuvimicrobium sp. KM1 TaxID=3377707 RepID=UPI00384B86EC
MRYRDENSTLKSHINSLRIVIGFQLLLIVGLWYGWHQSRNDIRFHIPPDLRSGAVLKLDEVPPPNVYAFAHYIFQQLNHWEENGETDYGKQVFRMAAYLTPEFRQFLTHDLELRGKRGELSGRVRGIQLIPGHGYEERRVDVLDRNTWLVWLDFRIEETVRGMDVKSLDIRYPIRVVRYHVDPEVNPWGLALDGFGGEGPQRLSNEEKAGGPS